MKIASRIKPRSGKPRVVTVHDRPYAFAPTEDKLGDQHFVADVHNTEHAELLLGSGDFYAYDETLAPRPQLQPAAASAAPPAAPLPNITALARTEAVNLLKGSAASISTGVGKVSGLAVVRAAMAIENTSPTPRKSVIALLQDALDGAIAAGVKE